MLIRGLKSGASAEDDTNPYWISFSDIMAGLLVIFILAALLMILQLTEQRENVAVKIEEVERANFIRSTILEAVSNALLAQGIIVEISDNESVLRIPSSTINFVTDQAELRESQKGVVEKIGIALINSINTENRREVIDTIFIEGHTDSRRSRYKGVGNWLLSADRAISIWRYWGDTESTNSLWNLVNFRNENMFSVSGYAATRRIAELDDTPELQERNRRIDLRFTMKQPEECEYQEITEVASC